MSDCICVRICLCFSVPHCAMNWDATYVCGGHVPREHSVSVHYRPTSKTSLHDLQVCTIFTVSLSVRYRLQAKKNVLLPAPPLGNFANISYLEENFKPHLLRDVCTLCSGALVSDSLLHMLLNKLRKKSK